MARWAPEKKHTLAALATEILHNYGRGRTIVAVDGTDTSATSRFADDLALAFTDVHRHAVRASIGAFHRPRAERERRGRGLPDARYRDAFDYSVFRRVLVEPFRMGEGASFVTSAFDAERDAAVSPTWTTAPRDAILIVDGVFLNRPELRGLWNYSIWLEGAGATGTMASGAVDTLPGDDALELYRTESSPRSAASAIIDDTDPDHPRRVFADSC